MDMELCKKALAVIENIALEDLSDAESVGLIYQAAHVALGECQGSHEEWRTWLEETYADLVRRGAIHAGHSNSTERLFNERPAAQAGASSGPLDGKSQQ